MNHSKTDWKNRTFINGDMAKIKRERKWKVSQNYMIYNERWKWNTDNFLKQACFKYNIVLERSLNLITISYYNNLINSDNVLFHLTHSEMCWNSMVKPNVKFTPLRGE